MEKKFFIVSLLFSFTLCSMSKIQTKCKIYTPSENSIVINQLKNKYSLALVYKSIEHSLSGFSSLSNRLNYLEYDDYVDSIILKNPQIVDILLEENENSILEILIWCEAFSLLDIPMSMKKTIPLEEIIYNIPQTNFLVRSFLQIEEQDWGSLSTSQIFELPYIVCNYIVLLKEKERLDFYESFIKTLIHLINE